MNQALFDYIAASPTAYHAVAHTADILKAAGYVHLCENDKEAIVPGGRYFMTRNGSSLIAFRVPLGEYHGFMISASHGDSPCFKIKENSELCGEQYVRLSTEKYGGMLCASWMDRPLSVAGRVTLRQENGMGVSLVDLGAPCAIIPHVAIHMNRSANDGASYNPSVDMLPILGTGEKKGTLKSAVAEKVGVAEADILTTDLFIYNPARGVNMGDIISSPRLDDLQCAYASLRAFLDAKESTSLPVYCLFDNEEVGSGTKQGAESTLLYDVLTRIVPDAAEYRRKLANSLLASCDNAHAVHPNHPELADKNHSVYMNRGVVIKYNANQKYTTDAVSAGLFTLICEKAGVPTQRYANRADMAGGSTLGNIATTKVSITAVDIGLSQLAMHSAMETAGAKDTGYMASALKSFFESAIKALPYGGYQFV